MRVQQQMRYALESGRERLKKGSNELYSFIWAPQLDEDYFTKTMVLTRF